MKLLDNHISNIRCEERRVEVDAIFKDAAERDWEPSPGWSAQTLLDARERYYSGLKRLNHLHRKTRQIVKFYEDLAT